MSLASGECGIHVKENLIAPVADSVLCQNRVDGNIPFWQMWKPRFRESAPFPKLAELEGPGLGLTQDI